jgi:hypothetical protein
MFELGALLQCRRIIAVYCKFVGGAQLHVFRESTTASARAVSTSTLGAGSGPDVSYHFICEWIPHAICEWSQSVIKAGLLLSKLNAFAALGLFSNRSIWTGHGDAVHNPAAAPFQGETPCFTGSGRFHSQIAC